MASPNTTPEPVNQLTTATLYLCGVSYYTDITTIPAAVGGTPTLAPGPHWECLWGPAQDNDESNLAFVAGYFPTADATLQYICVTVRGTDVDITDIWGIAEQIWQDIDATDPQPMPWAPNDPARIAGGTLDGLAIIEALTDTNGQSLKSFLQTLLSDPANANVTTLVTGHSLGGCLATVVAPWIESQRKDCYPTYKGVIQPIIFAGPTAGNSDFVAYYDTMFPLARRFQNSLDVIPRAFYDLSGIDSIYANDGLDVPDLVWGGLYFMKSALEFAEVTYVQPSRGAQLLPGTFLPNDSDDWYAQALHQHHLATYLGLLTNTPVNEATLPQPSVARRTTARLVKRIGSIDTLLKGVKES